MYRQLNIFVVLIGVEVWTQGNLINMTAGNGDSTMNSFLEYRRTKISPRLRNDNAQLIVGGILGEGVVGKAPIMTICSHRNSGGVSSDRNTAVGVVAATVAHELGHNLGLQHDDDSSCDCPDDRCIMTSSGGGWRFPTRWSECSRQQLSDSFHQGMDYCLLDRPRLDRVFDRPTCGNGLVEVGEDCDCGLDTSLCDNKCCDAKSCRLVTNATCASGLCCDFTTCQSVSAGSVCRASSGACDLEEYCDGLSAECPTDVHVQDGSECYDNGMTSYCYRGQCRTRESQCRRLWGSTAHDAHHLCYQHFNLLGTVNGHCGFDLADETFTKCAPRDVMCGMLHCSHSSEKLMFWKETLAHSLQETWVTTRDDQRHDCKGAILDIGLGMHDPGSVEDGTKCGDQQLCVAQRCVPLESLNASQCPDCHSHGVCNSLGQCHCYAGFAPPYCDRHGNGGSIHSGPSMTAGRAARPDIGLVVGLLVVCLVTLSSLGIAVYCFITRRSRLKKLMLRQCQPSQYDPVQKTVITVEVKAPVVDASGAGAQPNAAKRAVSVRRAASFRPEDISTPRLQSSTNSAVTPLICAYERSSLTETSQVLPHTAIDDGSADEFTRKSTATQNNGTERRDDDGEIRANRPTRKAPLPPTSNQSMESETKSLDTAIGSALNGALARAPNAAVVSSTAVVYQNSSEFMLRNAAAKSGGSKSIPDDFDGAERATENSTFDNIGDGFERRAMKPTRPPPPKTTCSTNDRPTRVEIGEFHRTKGTSRVQPTVALPASPTTDDNVTLSVTSLKSKFENSPTKPTLDSRVNCTVAISGVKLPASSSECGADVRKDAGAPVTRTPSSRPSVPPKPVTASARPEPVTT